MSITEMWFVIFLLALACLVCFTVHEISIRSLEKRVEELENEDIIVFTPDDTE